jgi:hypothetical protein
MENIGTQKQNAHPLTEKKKEIRTVSKKAKSKLTQHEKNKFIKELSKEINRNISRRMLIDLIDK